MSTIDSIIIFSTFSSRLEAEKIAKFLIKKRLAACVQILPKMESIYFWKHKIHKNKEHLMIIKSRKSLFEKVTKLIQENHSYETPEILALPVIKGSSDYLQWLTQVTSD